MSVYIPDPLCQFTDARGQEWGPTHWPDGTSRDYNSVNCGPTSAAWLLAFATRGLVQRDPPAMRRLTGDRQGGTSTADLARAITNAGASVTYRRALPLDRLRTALTHRPVAVLIFHDYEYLRGDSTFNADYDGDHFLVLLGGTIDEADGWRNRTIRAMDPIGTMVDGKRRAAWNRIRLSQIIAGARSASHAVGNPPDTVRAIVARQEPEPEPEPTDPCELLRRRVARWREQAEDHAAAMAEASALLRQAVTALDDLPLDSGPEA